MPKNWGGDDEYNKLIQEVQNLQNRVNKSKKQNNMNQNNMTPFHWYSSGLQGFSTYPAPKTQEEIEAEKKAEEEKAERLRRYGPSEESYQMGYDNGYDEGYKAAQEGKPNDRIK